MLESSSEIFDIFINILHMFFMFLMFFVNVLFMFLKIFMFLCFFGNWFLRFFMFFVFFGRRSNQDFVAKPPMLLNPFNLKVPTLCLEEGSPDLFSMPERALKSWPGGGT